MTTAKGGPKTRHDPVLSVGHDRGETLARAVADGGGTPPLGGIGGAVEEHPLLINGAPQQLDLTEPGFLLPTAAVEGGRRNLDFGNADARQADLYVTADGTLPTKTSHRWASADAGADGVWIGRSDAHRLPADSAGHYIVGVRAREPATVTLLAVVGGDKQASLPFGTPLYLRTADAATTTQAVVDVPYIPLVTTADHPNATAVQVSLSPLSGTSELGDHPRRSSMLLGVRRVSRLRAAGCSSARRRRLPPARRARDARRGLNLASRAPRALQQVAVPAPCRSKDARRRELVPPLGLPQQQRRHARARLAASGRGRRRHSHDYVMYPPPSATAVTIARNPAWLGGAAAAGTAGHRPARSPPPPSPPTAAVAAGTCVGDGALHDPLAGAVEQRRRRWPRW